MINARTELLGAVRFADKTVDDILCYKIERNCFGYNKECLSPKNTTNIVSDLDKLDFDYDDGYGIQELFGIVWFKDGSWLERGEYDGSEWWTYKFTPEIPQELL